MTYYRLYSVGGDGGFEAAEWIEASNDGDAVVMARDLRPTLTCELWDHGRLVARLPQKGPMAFFVPRSSSDEALGTVSRASPLSRP